MKFKAKPEYDITVTFEAPLLGFNIKSGYKARIEAFTQEVMKEMIEKKLNYIERHYEGWHCHIRKMGFEVEKCKE